MLHHPQVKSWSHKEGILFAKSYLSGGNPSAELQQERKNHNARWKNIQRHLQHRQNVTLLV